MREKTYERRIRSYIAERGGWSVKYFANAYTPRGVPDILACVGGRFLAIEVKAEDGRATELQVRTVNEILRSGGLAVIALSLIHI